jgi:hypothetical protein
MSTCLKCNTGEKIQKHHVFPKFHFGYRNNWHTVPLCDKCHRKIEANIASVESYVGNTKYGQRFKLEKSEYERILLNFVPTGRYKPLSIPY